MPSQDIGLINGYGAPYVKLFFNQTELSANVTDFSYEYYEEGDDVCKFEVRFYDRETPDLPYWQEKSELTIVWGFVGSNVIPRKIYLQQIKWDFDKDGVKAQIEATEKAVSMKYQDSQEVHKNVSLLDLAKKFADRHSLKALLQVDHTPSVSYIAPVTGPVPLSEFLVKNRKAISDQQRNIVNSSPGLKDGGHRPVASSSKTIPITDELINKVNSGDIADITSFINNYKESKTQYELDQENGVSFEQGFQKFMNKMPNAPQANRTDAQFLNEAAKRAPGGPWIVDTRDDELIIKKRNYNQVPYKSYTYGGNEGSISDFSPISKTRGRLPHSMNVGFQNWDPSLKAILTGNANPDNQDEETSLSTYVQVYKFYKGVEEADSGKGGSLRIGDLTPGKLPNQSKYNIIARSDNTVNTVNAPLYKLQDVSTRVDALKKAIEDKVQTMYNNTFNPSAVNSVDAYNQANNLRKANELKLNPATATMYGDPNLIVGKLITILGVSKKYSGNYYIIKSVHKIVRSGYTVNLEMATQGVNVKVSQNHKKTRGSLNRIVGPSNNTSTNRKIPVKKNP